MKRGKLIAGLLVVFLSGVLVGALGTAFYVRNRVLSVIEGGPREMRKIIMERIDSKIGLSDDQRKRVNEIIKEAQDRYRKLREESSPEVQGIIDDADSMMRDVLEDEQKAKLKGMVDKLKKRWHKREDGLEAKPQPEIEVEKDDISEQGERR